jgi:hypothetical protein
VLFLVCYWVLLAYFCYIWGLSPLAVFTSALALFIDRGVAFISYNSIILCYYMLFSQCGEISDEILYEFSPIHTKRFS